MFDVTLQEWLSSTTPTHGFILLSLATSVNLLKNLKAVRATLLTYRFTLAVRHEIQARRLSKVWLYRQGHHDLYLPIGSYILVGVG